MKKLAKWFLVIACLAISGSAAAKKPMKAKAASISTTIDFETLGQDWAWTLFENVDNAPTLYAVVPNPSAVGVNTSANVAKYVVNKAAMPWAGLWSSNLGSLTFSADNCKVKVMVYKDVISNFDVKFENDNASVAFEKQVSNTKINEWEELTFDFSAQIGKTVTKLVIIPDFPAARSAGSLNYWDNISFNSNSNVPVIGVPTVAAPTPTKDASKVISIFSNAYTDVAATNFAASWGQSTVVSTVNIATNPTLKYENLNYQGTELGSHVDASKMNYLHVDVWTPNETVLQITPISPGQEKLYTLTPLTLNGWNSFDIPLSAFPNVVMSDVFQFKVVGAGGNIVYLDNLYFYDNTQAADTQAPTAFTAKSGTATTNSVEVLMNATDNSGSVVYALTAGTKTQKVAGVSGVEKSFVINNLRADTTFVVSVEAKDSAGNAAANNPILVTVKTLANPTNVSTTINFETLGQDWAWTLFENVDNAPTLYSVVPNPSAVGINPSASVAKYVVNKAAMPWAGLWSSNLGSLTFSADNCKVKVMVYKDVISNFDVKFENDNASVAFEKQVSNTKINEWEELTFDFSAQIGKTVTKLVIIPDFPAARSAGSLNYWDNISFNSNSNIPVIGVPTVAAPTPTKDASKVISIFSNAYTDVAATNFAASWGQSTVVSTVNIATNPTLKYENLNYQGTELGAHVNAGAMNYLHVDVWTPNETVLQITPLSPGQEKLYTLTPLTLNGWNSFDIPLSAFPNVVMSDIFQFKVVGAGGNIVYLDNLYFYDNTQAADTQAPTAFTAKSGTATASSVEVLMNATDNSGAVVYTLSSGNHKEDVNGVSGVEKSFVINNLRADTTFVISVVAKDAAGNAAANNPIEVTVKTLANVVVSGPSTAAPTPPAYAAPKVISIFSEAYTPIAGTSNFNPNWGQSTAVTTETVAGSAMLKYANLNYQGLEFGSDVNAVAMKFLHIDVYTENETSLQIFPISRATGEKFVQLTPLNLNAWNSFDIPLSDFTSKGLSLADIFQFKFVGSGGKTVYLDNLYFYDNSAATDTEAPTAFTATKGIIASDGVELLLTASDNTGAVGFEITFGTTTLKTGGVSGVQKSFVVQGLTPSTDYSFSVVAKDATGNIAANSPIVVTARTSAAMAGAPVPTVAADKVISIFSNTYPNVANTNFNPGWGQSTAVSMVVLAGDTTLKYANLNYQGTELSKHIDASKMTKLHIDVYTVNETSLQITPISPAHEKLVALTPLNQNVWNSFDVPLSSFTGVVLSDIFQFKIVGSGGKTVYLDNLYFFDDSTPITSVMAENALTVYPSKVSDRLSMRSNSIIRAVQIRNLVGQVVKTVVVNNTEMNLDLTGLSTGNYLVNAKMANGQMITKKIVKM